MAVESAAEYLPSQGPIGIFIHHNPLHAFEWLPFERAAEEAARLLGCKAFLPEAFYRKAIAAGRIRSADLDAVIAAELGETQIYRIGGLATRGEILRQLLLYGLPPGPYPQVEWLVRETGTLGSRRPDPPAAPDGVSSGSRPEAPDGRGASNRPALESLWAACQEASLRAEDDRPGKVRASRHRDALLASTGEDADELVHPRLIRACAAFLDQGLARSPAPGGDLEFFTWFRTLYAETLPLYPEAWMRQAARRLEQERCAEISARDSIAQSLAVLGVPEGTAEPFLIATALALRGWAGMIRQIEVRPDRVPLRAPKAGLAGFLAARLVLDCAAVRCIARKHGLGDSPEDLGSLLHTRPATPERPVTRAWRLFHLSRILTLDAAAVGGLTRESLRELLAEIAHFKATTRERLLHQAYERQHRTRALEAFSAFRPRPAAGAPAYQAVFCIDEREESMRRHLEEVDPDCETFGTVGFFGVAMYYRGLGDAKSRPLCPIAVQPVHEVREVALEAAEDMEAIRRFSRRLLGHGARIVEQGSRSSLRGLLVSIATGPFAAVRLVLRTLFPRLAGRLRRGGASLVGPTRRNRLEIRLSGSAPGDPSLRGFSLEEMAAIVREQLENTGLARYFSPLVLIVGHGSSSLNNPHESAHDCGACGGGRGGPNARAFAQMANDPDVRRLLAAGGLVIPQGTRFLAAEHNTCNDSLEFFDRSHLPGDQAALFRKAFRALGKARRRNALERCRRFHNAPSWYTPTLALAHVEARVEDLAQPRPEYGHASNAYCIVARRERTRGLFLDRRAFLVSYDHRLDDPGGSLLSRILASTVPVTAGINLEYFFGFVDDTGYGCGTKLPHNITSLLGVMDGHASDLRTGLPWQMLEIHEPLRLLLAVEAPPETLAAVLERLPDLKNLVRNRWLWLAALDPSGSGAWEWSGGAFVPAEAGGGALQTVGTSGRWTRGKRDPLPMAVIGNGGR